MDGLLRALGLSCRTIHAQLQQRQRIRSLEAFRAETTGVLVATDVAARGLDIPQIEAILHYDVARSPQVNKLLSLYATNAIIWSLRFLLNVVM